MPKIREDIVQAVLDRARIEDVVGEFVTLRKAGVNMTGICPFHDDKHDGNFIVRPSTISEKNHGNTYRCFVCDKKGGPVQFLMDAERMTFPDAIRWLGRKYCVEVDDVPMNWTPPPPRPRPAPLPVLEIPRAYVKRTMDIATWGEVTFRNWYMSLPWNAEQMARAHETLWMYCVGGYRDGSVVWWQIDAEGIPRAAKLMKYQADGHRCKGKFDTSYLYAKPECKERLEPDKHTILHPLFGTHLLKRYPKAIVNLVESEKTALVMANFYGSPDKQLWLACGGIQNMRLESMQPLIDQGKTVWLWPDKDGVSKWQELADKLGSDRVNVYTKFFDSCWREEDGEKADCADIIIRMMTTGDQPREVKHTGDPQSTTEIIATASDQSGVNSAATPEPIGDDPFLDAVEMADPRVHEWRMKCAIQSSGWGNPRGTGGVKTVGEIIQEHPILREIINGTETS